MKRLRLLRDDADQAAPHPPPPPIDLDSIPFAFVVGVDPRWASMAAAPASEPLSGAASESGEQRPSAGAGQSAVASSERGAKRRLISREELAVELKVDVKTIDRRRKRGELPKSIDTRNGRIIWDRDEMDQWLEANPSARKAPKQERQRRQA